MIALGESRRPRVLPLRKFPVRHLESVREAMLKGETKRQEFSSSWKMRRLVVKGVVLFAVVEQYIPVCYPSQMA
jgi:hypothetical protein